MAQMIQTFSRWRALFQSGEQAALSAYNQLLKKEKEIEELKKQLDALQFAYEQVHKGETPND